MNSAVNWYKVLEVDALPEGRIAAVTIGTAKLVITHFNGEYGALEDRCPHEGTPLSEGCLFEGQLKCPEHGWSFHPITGKMSDHSPLRVRTFPVDVRGDGIYIGIENF